MTPTAAWNLIPFVKKLCLILEDRADGQGMRGVLAVKLVAQDSAQRVRGAKQCLCATHNRMPAKSTHGGFQHGQPPFINTVSPAEVRFDQPFAVRGQAIACNRPSAQDSEARRLSPLPGPIRQCEHAPQLADIVYCDHMYSDRGHSY